VSSAGWRRSIGRFICIGHFPQKSPLICGSFVENDLQLKASYASSPHCTVFSHWICCGELTFENIYQKNTALNTLQHTATHCNTLQHTATHTSECLPEEHCTQHAATRCNTLQHTATHTSECLPDEHTAATAAAAAAAAAARDGKKRFDLTQ